MKKILSVLLPLTICFSIITTGCGTNKENAKQESSKQNADTSNVNPAGQYPIVKDKITMTAFMVQLPYISDLVNNDFTKYFENKTNIHLDMTIAPQAAYQDKLNLALSSGDYPEIIMSGGFNSGDLVKYGMQEKIILPLNSYIDQYGVELKRLFNEVKILKGDLTAPDGNIYGLPSVDESYNSSIGYKFWVNTDWLKKLGLDKPKNTDEFKNMLIAFKTKDPNGNGKNDEIPMSGAIKTWAADSYLYLMNSFTYFDDKTLLTLSKGQFTFQADSPEFRDGVRYLNDLFKSGLIDPAAFTQDMSQLQKLGSSNPVVLGSFSAGHLQMGIDINNVEKSKQYDALPPIKGPKGFAATRVSTPGRVTSYKVVITNKCKNPAAAYRLADALYNEEVTNLANVGVKGAQWEDAKPGEKGLYGDQAKYRNIVVSSNNSVSYRWSGTSIFSSTAKQKGEWAIPQDIYDPAAYQLRLNKITDLYMPFKAAADEIPPLFVDPDTNSKLTQLQTAVKDYVVTSMVEFITGKKDIEKDWDTYLKGLDKVQVKEYISQYKKAYDLTMSNRK